MTEETTQKPWEKFSEENTTPWEKFSEVDESKSNADKRNATAGALAVGGGLAAKYMLKPFTESRGISKELGAIQKEAGISGLDPSSAPKVLRNMAANNALDQTKENLFYEQRIKSSSSKLKAKTSSLKNSMLAGSIDDVAKSIQQDFPKWTTEAYNNYGSGLAAIETSLDAKGVTFDTKMFVNEVLNPTIEKAVTGGATPDELKGITKFRNNLIKSGKSVIVDQTGQKLNIKNPVSLKQLKGNVFSLKGKLPNDARYRITENWGKFLEKNVPEAEAVQLKELNSSYKPMAEARKAISKTFDRNTGIYDRGKLHNWISKQTFNQAYQGLDNSKLELMDFLSEGNKLSKPMKSLKTSLKGLSKDTMTLKSLNKAVGKVNKLSSEASIKGRLDVIASKEKFLKWANKIENKLAQRQGITTKYPVRSAPIKIGRMAAGFGRVVKGAMSVVPPTVIVPLLSGDVETAMARMMGEDIPSKGSKERIILEKVSNKVPLTTEEKKLANDPTKSLYKLLGGI